MYANGPNINNVVENKYPVSVFFTSSLALILAIVTPPIARIISVNPKIKGNWLVY